MGALLYPVDLHCADNQNQKYDFSLDAVLEDAYVRSGETIGTSTPATPDDPRKEILK